METSKIRIVADSSADMLKFDGANFASVPLKIITSQKEYVDNEQLDPVQMANELKSYTGKSSTACPAPGEWLAAFDECEYVFCVTITSGLSGSYNAACIAKQQYEEQNPGKRVCVVDTLSAGPEMKLVVEKLSEYANNGMSFDEMCGAIGEYMNKTALLFALSSMTNLANNGRVSPIVAKAAGLLGIRGLGKASAKGDLEMLEKPRGEKKTLTAIVSNMKKMGYVGGKVRIGHCINEEGANKLAALIKAEYKTADIEIYPSLGLCSFYQEVGGLMVGFEH